MLITSGNEMRFKIIAYKPFFWSKKWLASLPAKNRMLLFRLIVQSVF